MDRRAFLKAGLTGVAAFSMSGLTRAYELPTTNATIATLIAESTTRTMIDSTPLFVWQFRDPVGSGPGALPSGLLVQDGDTLEITVDNRLDRPINFAIPGVLTGEPAVDPGNSRVYSFAAPAAGSYYYCDEVNGEMGRALGLLGPLIVMPADGSNRLNAGGPAFDRQYTLVLGEYDDRLNDAIASNQSFDMADFAPNYFFVNGLSFPDTAGDTDTLIAMAEGENVALRLVNSGVITNPMHFHGYHVEVATRDRVPETVVVDKDTVLVDVGECVDLILPVSQAGTFPLHTHFVPGVTANGTYVNPYGGSLVIMEAV